MLKAKKFEDKFNEAKSISIDNRDIYLMDKEDGIIFLKIQEVFNNKFNIYILLIGFKIIKIY